MGGITGGYFAGDWFISGVAIWLHGCCAGALLAAVDLGFFLTCLLMYSARGQWKSANGLIHGFMD